MRFRNILLKSRFALGFSFYFAFLVWANTGLGATVMDVYSESAYLGREDVYSMSTRVRNEHSYDVHPWIYPFAEGGVELQSLGQGNPNLSPASYGFFGGGLKFKFGPLVLRPGARLRGGFNEYTASYPFPPWDVRFLVAYGDFFQTESGIGPFFAFAEPYSETLYTSADVNNVIHDTFVRFGLRTPITRGLLFDLLTEPFVTVDRVGHYYNNRADLKFGTRFQQTIGPVSLSLSGSVVANAYFNVKESSQNPYLGKIWSFRALFVAGAMF